MPASFALRTLASLFAAAAIGTLSPACSLGVEPSLDEEGEGSIIPLPPLLELETPRTDLVYGIADDELLEEPGIQLRLRVRVNDLAHGVWLEDVALGVDNEHKLVRVPVREDWQGQRRAELSFTVFPDEDIRDVTLLARAGTDLATLEQRIRVAPLR